MLSNFQEGKVFVLSTGTCIAGYNPLIITLLQSAILFSLFMPWYFTAGVKMLPCLQDFCKHLVPSCFDVYYTQSVLEPLLHITLILHTPIKMHSGNMTQRTG